jgi:phosphotriesterase-related protein
VNSVNTIAGPISTTELGFTLMHEHISSASAGFWHIWPQVFGGREQFISTARRLLSEAKREGVDTFVDATTIDLGRDIRLIRDAAEGTGMNVVASTGWWLDASRAAMSRTVEELTDFFTLEIEEGIEGTGIRAGVIKVANHENVTDFGEKVLRAGARASKATGVPIITHSGARWATGLHQARIFEDEGIDPGRVNIGHSDDSTDIEYLASICKRGFWLGMDRLPLGALDPPFSPPSVEARVRSVVELIALGFASRLLLSHDEPLHLGIATTQMQQHHKSRIPDGILFLSRKFLPALRQKGVDDKTIQQIMVDNPRRFFEG